MANNKIFRADQLSKLYKDCRALNNVSFSIEKGDVFGLIGENGAGKTTLMKIIAGCTNASSGRIAIMGNTDGQMHKARKNMGVIIENPAYYGDMNGAENLEIIRLARGISDKSVVNTTLDTVGLREVKLRKVSKYSLGMRQRLGLAMTLIGAPQFLILDEPTNGLDPNGIIDMRNLLVRLNQEYGITLLISSHILTELNQVATRYGILHKGELIALHTARELQDQCQTHIIILHEDNPENIAEFLSHHNVTDISISSNVIKLADTGNLPHGLLSKLINEKFNIIEFYSQQETLEEYFVRLTKGKEVTVDA